MKKKQMGSIRGLSLRKKIITSLNPQQQRVVFAGNSGGSGTVDTHWPTNKGGKAYVNACTTVETHWPTTL